MSDQHLTKIREQFTRIATVYAHLMATTQEKGLRGLVRSAKTAATDRVLDVACGPGFLTMTFAQSCAQAVGFDATDAFLELARDEAERRGLQNIRFEHGDAQQLPYEAGSFDVVACRAAFHHFPTPERVLSEMVRVLADGGRILVADLLGSEDASKAVLHDRIEQLCDPTHVRALPVSELERMFEAAGLRVIGRGESSIDYDVEEWISHGAPTAAVAAEIVALMEATMPKDSAGLRVRREEGRLRFSHYGASFVLGR